MTKRGPEKIGSRDFRNVVGALSRAGTKGKLQKQKEMLQLENITKKSSRAQWKRETPIGCHRIHRSLFSVNNNNKS